MPMTPFIGVRISWLMFARNSLLAWFAASAVGGQLDGSAHRFGKLEVGLTHLALGFLLARDVPARADHVHRKTHESRSTMAMARM